MKESFLKKESAPLGTLENPIIDSAMTREQALRPNPKFEIPQEIFEMQELVTVKYLSFDGKYHQGQMVVDKRLKQDVEDFFQFLISEKFPVNKVVPVAHPDYDFSDDKSMEANNASGFNPRTKVGPISGSKELSMHAMGWAIDINPLLNPYFGGEGRIPVTPENPDATIAPGYEELYNIDNPGTITPQIAKFLKDRGWTWGLEWYNDKKGARVDIHHFEKPLGKIPVLKNS
ncbi:M15 family metallopeptidase [Candidatus Nomurabacteria bacterium]|nr:M15 family metallopeptidase [Candidatus Nomurabacteria bacterium]